MKKVSSQKPLATLIDAQKARSKRSAIYVRFGLIAALGVASAVYPPSNPQAQRSGEKGASVKDVSTSRQNGETTVSITGDGTMNRVQTWQDKDGFHVVFPGGKGAPAKLPSGVKAQRVGDSLELVVPTKPGSSVTVQPRGGRLDLVVSGGLSEGEGSAQQRARENFAPPDSSSSTARERQSNEDTRMRDGSGRRAASNDPVQQRENTSPRAKEDAAQPQSQGDGAENSNRSQQSSDAVVGSPEVSAKGSTQASAQVAVPVGEAGFSLFTMTGMLTMSGLMCLVGLLVVVRRRRSSTEKGAAASKKKKKKTKAAETIVEEIKPFAPFELPQFEPYKGDRRKQNVPVANDRRRATEEAGQRFSLANGALMPEGTGENIERKSQARLSSANVPSVLFGAYRIDQEVGKLVHGQPHSIEVLASRAPDDRRAIETSLVKALNSHETGEDGRRRVRQALEDYGFVARQSASLLLSPESYERVSAARVLGQVKSESSLPFLLEALYDGEPIVRTEAVTSLGSLGLPKAIGAIIDMARRYPDIPASLLSPALTACSFEAQEWGWVSPAENRVLLEGASDHRSGEMPLYDVPPQVSELPEWLEDENLSEALERLDSADVEARISAAQSLAQFPARRSVEALTAILVRDENAAVRAAAVTSLGVIDHESVFAPVLYALADDSREVRAAAARAYSSVNFERSDAAAHLVETADRETLEDLARACVKSGVVAQSLDRLASQDRRHAYEAFSMLSLVIRGGETKSIIEAVKSHPDPNVRMAAVRLASLTGNPELQTSLRGMAGQEEVSADMREAITEAFDGAQMHI